MNKPQTPADSAASLAQVAADWNTRMAQADVEPAVRSAFQTWYGQDPAHAAAYVRIERTRHALSQAADAPELIALRHGALARLHTRNRKGARRRHVLVSAAACLLAVVAVTALFRAGRPIAIGQPGGQAGAPVYETGVGMRTVVTLEDGSVATLDTDSRIFIHYASGVRGVTLERGQAMFQVAHDAAHPFVVTAGGRQVTALGTQFDVSLSSQQLEVTLVEGRVTVAPGGGSAANGTTDAEATAELHPGEQYVQNATATPMVRPADLRRITSWTSGQLIFDNDQLADVVAQMNRYARRKIVIADPRLAALRISGAFPTGGTPTFIDALTAYYPVAVVGEDQDRLVIARRQ